MEALDQDSAPKELFYTEGPPTLRDARLQACALDSSLRLFVCWCVAGPANRCHHSDSASGKTLSCKLLAKCPSAQTKVGQDAFYIERATAGLLAWLLRQTCKQGA